MRLRDFFLPDHRRYEGVRPIQIWGMRLFYALMAGFVATDAWSTLLRHEGDWAPMTALVYCVWATYPTLAVLGLLHPLRLLPILLFTIGYKTLWFVFVAGPLCARGTLAGSSAEPMTNAFLALPLLVLVVPWGYVWRTHVMPARRVHA